ncbi:hypothetical protein J7T55_014005 [Diaporthe amygdali]|uniref:uncharacterized protein n=1 Tax=Phomopsis amygdali TaxID=1214568 RepID=UPI0022FEC53B|nr:uncharacterized protein J7T55_014005 [Diaporthe amygdali]KAJ0119801.1 hypothetical protein J7T55_014005 [Diaporthe amygdali]
MTQQTAPDMLSSLPVELLTNVVDQLSWIDYMACRLTCRRIEAVTSPSFSRDAFTTCCIIRTPESIQTLIDVSKSRMSSHVKTLVVSTEVLCFPNESFSDQDAFISTGCDREMLTEALQNLHSIQTVQLRTISPSRSVNMSATPRDPSLKRRSFGMKKIIFEQEKMMGSDGKILRPTLAGNSHFNRLGFHSTLLALGKANARPKGLSIFGMGSTRDPISLRIPRCIALSAIPVLARLEKLALDVCPGTHKGSVSNPAYPRVENRVVSTHDLRSFLQHVPRLKSLCLFLNCFENQGDGFVEWLGSDPPPEGLALGLQPRPSPAITFNYLQALTICFIRGVRVQAMLSVLRKFAPTLVILQLEGVHLENSLSDHASPPSAPGSVWAELLEHIKAEPSHKLWKLSLLELMETDHASPAPLESRALREVTFAVGQKQYENCSYEGREMGKAVEGMVRLLRGDSSWTPSFRDGRFEVTGIKA